MAGKLKTQMPHMKSTTSRPTDLLVVVETQNYVNEYIYTETFSIPAQGHPSVSSRSEGG